MVQPNLVEIQVTKLYPQGSDAERVFAQSCVSLWHPLICDLHSANESFKLGFFFFLSIKVFDCARS